MFLSIKYALAAGLTLLVVAGAASAAAQSLRLAPADPAADRLVAEALEKTPDVAATRAAVEAAQRRIEPARTLPDPSGSFTYQNEGRSLSLGEAEGTFAGLMLSQPLPWPGKLSLAGRVAESEAKEVSSGLLNRTALSIEARVRTAWYDLALARAIDRLVDERRQTARVLEDTTRNRYEAGLAVQQDVLRAQVERTRLDELKAGQRALIAGRLAELNRLLARSQDAPLETSDALPAVSPLPETSAIIGSALSRSPEAAAARQAIETGRLRVEVAKKNFLPDFVVSGGSMYRGSFEMGPMWQVGVAVSLPIWVDKRQQNQLAEAQARVAEQTAQTDVVGRELEVRTRERIAQLQTANEVAALYETRIVPLDQLTYESALASYQSGKVPLITVLDAVNALYSDRANSLGRLAEAAKWRVAIDEASLQATSMSGAPSIGAAPMGGSSTASAAPQSQSSSTSTSMTSMR